MNPAEALQLAERNGIHIGVSGPDLILEAEREPAPNVLEAIKRNKSGILALLRQNIDTWSAHAWRRLFDERAASAEGLEGKTRAQAERIAFNRCVIEWLNRHPAVSPAGRCAWCLRSDSAGHRVVPLGAQGYGHTWLHPECWQPWFEQRRHQAERALFEIGIGQKSTRMPQM